MVDAGHWKPLRMTAIGMALVMAMALVTGLILANSTGTRGDSRAQVRRPEPRTSSSWPAELTATPRPVAGARVPPQAAIEE
jgi:hypothetical protein